MSTHAAITTSSTGRRRTLAVITNGFLLLGIALFLLIALGPHVLGYRTATMLTGSMEPGINPGDVVVTVPRPAADLQVGDVISYAIPIEDHRIETHRVTDITHNADGTLSIQTKGDNNENKDPWVATLQGDTVWETTAVIPELGSAVRVLRAPAVQHGVFWVAFGGLLLMGLTMIWSTSDEDDTDTDGDDDTDGDGPRGDAEQDPSATLRTTSEKVLAA